MLLSNTHEREAEAVATWISRHGEAAGFRVPNTRERSRAMGMGAYLADLGLSENELYDGQGKSFDPQAVVIRLRDGLRRWAQGDVLPRQQYPAMDRVEEAFQEVHAYVEQRGLLGCTRPFPHDLRDRLIAAALTPQLSDTPPEHLSPAAEDGRRTG